MKLAILLLALTPLACDDTSSAPPTPAASAQASAAAQVPSAAPVASASATSTASAAASSPADPGASAPTKDTVVSVFDPVKEPARTVRTLTGGTVALYLPEWAGTSWKVTAPSAVLGKAKEETIPGFAGPTTPAHAFTWKVKDGLKGQTVVVPLANSAKGGAGTKTFTLTIVAT